MPAAALPHRSLIAVSGAEAETLLQAVITTDLAALLQGEAKAGALLTPQGKILFDFVISRSGADGFLIETDESRSADLVRRLMLYRLRAKAEIAPLADQRVTVAWGDAAAEGLVDRRFRGDERVVRHYGGDAASDASIGDYDRLRIRSGVAELDRDYAASDVFPHDILLDLNEGVSFRKGCFVGQEVVSRMQHRGTARRRLAIVRSDGDLPEPGTAVNVGDRPLGELGSVVGNEGLAIVRIDRVAEAQASGTAITAGERSVSLSFPAWTGLGFEAPLAGTGSA